MEISVARKVVREAVPVFLLREREQLEAHPFFKFLSAPDRQFLQAFQKKSPLKDTHSHLVFLPSSGEAILLGISERKKFTHRKALLAMRRAIAFARRERVKQLSLSLDDFRAGDFRGTPDELAEILATELELANFEFTQYKAPPPEGWQFVERVFVSAKHRPKNLAKSLAVGKTIGEEINRARSLANTPAGDLHPSSFSREAQALGKQYGFAVKVLGRAHMEKLGMGGILGVGKGSAHEPKFVIAEYWGGKGSDSPVVLVGKGVTFDAGGLNLKPESGIYEMHMDMSGGAAVLHAVAALARLKVKVNAVALVPVAENMPSGSSYHPGDLLRTMSGKTIEVLNTDAEGRIILADGLTYAQKFYKPRLVVDVATLTGAAMAALGQRASAIFTRDRRLENQLRTIGEQVGDFVWPLPLWEEYEDEVKGTFGDVANVGKTRYGGAITGAVFLWQFVKNETRDMRPFDAAQGKQETRDDVPWVHIDIAPRMTSIEGDFLAKGSAGPAVALLVHFLRKY